MDPKSPVDSEQVEMEKVLSTFPTYREKNQLSFATRIATVTK